MELAILAVVVTVIAIFGRGLYRLFALHRGERAFLTLAKQKGLPRSRAMEFVNLARARGTTAMAEASEEARRLEANEINMLRKAAGIAVMERAARDEFNRLSSEGQLGLEQISEAADAAGIEMLNQYVKAGAPLGDDSLMAKNPAALKALINNCNDDLRGLSEGQYYTTQIGRVANGSSR